MNLYPEFHDQYISLRFKGDGAEDWSAWFSGRGTPNVKRRPTYLPFGASPLSSTFLSFGAHEPSPVAKAISATLSVCHLPSLVKETAVSCPDALTSLTSET